MRIQEIFELIKDYAVLGLTGLVILSVICALGYFVIYKRVLNGQKTIKIKHVLVGSLFVAYLVMVVGITFMNRGSYYQGHMNLHFLSSYREAWNTFTLRSWQFLVLNIILFMPLGFFLPLVHRSFKKFYKTLMLAFIFTLLIEATQYVTRLGIFEIDDIFNNTLGAIIGYGLIMFLVKLKDKKSFLKSSVYLSPLVITILAFVSVFAMYELQDYGNLGMAYSYKLDMSQVKIDFEVQTDDVEKEVAIYKAPIYSQDEAEQMAISFFENIGIDTRPMSIDAYNDNAYYWIRGKDTYNIKVDFIGGAFSFGDFSSFEKEPMDLEEEQINSTLLSYGISIPQQAELIHDKTGLYQWRVNMLEKGDALIDGMLSCTYYEDETIKNITNSLIEYKKVDQVPIKSTNQVIADLSSGKFKYFKKENIESMTVKSLNLKYALDSKGFYRPVYKVETAINGEEYSVFIEAN